MSKGLVDTSISDITRHAGVAKGTFYLYFKDKYSIRDSLVSRSSRKLFLAAHNALKEKPEITGFEDKIIFIIDHIVAELENNRPLFYFISKNLSWGLFHHMFTEDVADHMTGQEIFEQVAKECNVTIKDPDIMGFIIVEMTNSATYSALFGNEQIPMERLLPYINDTVRAIIRNHIV